MYKKYAQRVLFVSTIVGLMLASFFVGRMLNKPMTVQAQEVTGDETRGSASFNCNVNQVAIYSDRAHIRCVSPVVVGSDTVYYFAIANTRENEMFINRVMAIGLTNMSMNRAVYIWYDTLSSNNPPGCQTNDCRLLLAASGLN
jgi:hypothetical protein